MKGGGYERLFTYTGLMIYDTESGEITFMHWNANKIYTVSTSSSYHKVDLAGANGRSFTVLAASGSHIDEYGNYYLFNNLMQGLNRSLTIATGATFSFPSVLTGNNNRSIQPDNDGNERFYVWTETFNFAKATVADNNAGLTAADVVARVSANLEAKGFVRH